MQDSSPVSYSRMGVLDIGSNSVRFVIYQLFGSSFTPVYNEKVLAGLGRDLRKSGRLSETGRERALGALKRFSILAKTQKLDTVLVGATAALRDAEDAADFIRQVQEETGLDVHPVSGAEEARLTAMGVIAAEFRADGIAADLGGASLELIHIDGGSPEPGVSFPIGPFQVMGQEIGGAADFDAGEVTQRICQALETQTLPSGKSRPLYLIGGAWRNLAAVHQERTGYPLKTLQGYTLSVAEALELACWAYGDGRETLLTWPDMASRRAETLPYSALMLDVLIKQLEPSKIIISSTGLREGLIYNSIPEKLRARDSLYDGCRDLARGNLQEVHFDAPLMRFLADIEADIPHVFDPHNEARLRKAACSLVGIGKGLHPDYRAALVFEDVLYAPLSDLNHKERAYLALILFSSYTGRALTPNDDAIQLLLTDEERMAARIYGFAIRLAVVASGRSADLLQEYVLKIVEGTLTLKVHAAYADLMSERVEYRLAKLGQLPGLPVTVELEDKL